MESKDSGSIANMERTSELWRQNLGRTSICLGQPRGAEWWTGLAPEHCPGFADGKLRSLPMPNLSTCTRKEVRDYFDNTWTLTEVLFSALQGDEAFYRPPYHSLRHPLIFYYVHPAVLYVNKMRLAGIRDAGINPYFETLFEMGVDEMSWDDMSKNDISWPNIDEAHMYRRQAYAAITSLIETHPDLAEGHVPLLQDHELWSLFMGLEHERIHLETSSVLMRELPIRLVFPPKQWPDLAPMRRERTDFSPVAGRDYPENSMVEVPELQVDFGKPAELPGYGWDNEYGRRSSKPEKFAAGRFLISNGEFFQFIADGGYERHELWTEIGWRWRSFRNVKHPTFWIPLNAKSNSYKLRTCFKEIPMQWDWPAVVNYHEAKAFTIWKSQKEHANFSLLTEAQHQALRRAAGFANTAHFMIPRPFNINLRYGSESAVDALSMEVIFPDLFGNVWQWGEDHFNPLDGSNIHYLYSDFSTPCYDGEHQMIFGGSFVSTGDEATPWARFHFRPHFFQHAGFRIVRNADGDGAVTLIN